MGVGKNRRDQQYRHIKEAKRSKSLIQGRVERKSGEVGKILHLESESLDLNANSITYPLRWQAAILVSSKDVSLCV